MNDGWSGSVGPEAGEPSAFSSGHGEHQAVLAGIVVPGTADGQYQAMQGGERMLDSEAQDGLTKEAHQVVGEHGEAQGRFRGPEVVHVERIQTEIGLEFLDPILTISAAPVGALNFCHGQIERGHKRPITPALNVRIVREQRQRLAGRRLAFGHHARLGDEGQWT